MIKLYIIIALLVIIEIIRCWSFLMLTLKGWGYKLFKRSRDGQAKEIVKLNPNIIHKP